MDIGALATEFAHARGFQLRLKGLVGRFLCRMAESDTEAVTFTLLMTGA